MPGRRYALIYADPPWSFRDANSNGARGAIHKYPTLSLSDIKQLPVASLAADNAACFLWVTSTHLMQGGAVLHAWGFQYKTIAFVWTKTTQAGGPKMGLGHYTRPNTELCLLGLRGRLERCSRAVLQEVREPPREHSRKPDVVRDRIVDLFGDLPRIELFARPPVPAGWDAWGLDIKPKDRPVCVSTALSAPI